MQPHVPAWPTPWARVRHARPSSRTTATALPQVHGLELSMPPTLNPFRQPLERGHITGFGGFAVPWISNGWIAAINSRR